MLSLFAEVIQLVTAIITLVTVWKAQKLKKTPKRLARFRVKK